MIRTWIDHGLLEEVGDTSMPRVTLQSVLEVRPLVRELRELGHDRDLLKAVLARIEDERTLSNRKLRKSLDEMRSGNVIPIATPRRPCRTRRNERRREQLDELTRLSEPLPGGYE